MRQILWILILAFSCSPKTPPPHPEILSLTLKECLETYKLDGTFFDENTHLVVNVTVHELLEDSMRYPMEVYDSMIINLNKIYAMSNISFYLASVLCCNPVPYASAAGIYRYAKAHNITTSLNLYVVPDDTTDYKGSAEDVPSIAAAVQRAWLCTSTASHEFGHMLGLKHVHEPDKTTGYNPWTGDQICDTPSPGEYFGNFPDCFKRLFDKTSDESVVLLQNIMSHNYDVCRKNLTLVQAARVRLTFELNTDLRKTIKTKISPVQ